VTWNPDFAAERLDGGTGDNGLHHARANGNEVTFFRGEAFQDDVREPVMTAIIQNGIGDLWTDGGKWLRHSPHASAALRRKSRWYIAKARRCGGSPQDSQKVFGGAA